MKPNIPLSARWSAWWHEAFTGHRTHVHFAKGKYRRYECCGCGRTFHYPPIV